MLLIKALLLLSTATAVFAKGRVDAIVSGACLVGQDKTLDNAHGEKIFRNPLNHASAVASILRWDAERADFQPRQKGVITDQRTYDQFLKDVYVFPGFKPHQQKKRDLDLQGDREQFKREIAKKYGSERNDPQLMARAFERLLPREMERDNQEWLLNYVIMNIENMHGGNQLDIEVEIVSVTLKLCKDQNSNQTKIKRQTAELILNTFSVKTEYLMEHASELAQRIRTMRARKALKELSSTGRLGDEDSDDDEDDLELEAWFEGSYAPDYLPRAFPISRWNVQY